MDKKNRLGSLRITYYDSRILCTYCPVKALDQGSSAVLNLCNLCNHLNP